MSWRLLALSLVLLGCHSLLYFPDKPLTEGRLPCPAGDGWRTVISKHFVVYTDRSPKILREAAASLEEIYGALAQLPLANPGKAGPPAGRITVVIFSSKEDFRQLFPDERFTGWYREVDNGFASLPMIALTQELGADVREPIVHELTHRFLRHAAPGAPTWLHEGMADYLSSLHIRPPDVIVGEVPRKLYHHHALNLALTRLLFADVTEPEFHGSAFSLVHLLNDTVDRQRAFRSYLDLLAQGVEADRAFAQALGGLDWHEIEAALPAYLPQFSYPTQSFNYRDVGADQFAVRAVTHAELHRLWATIRPWSKQTRALAERDIEEAERLEPEATRALRLQFAAEIGDDARVLAGSNALLKTSPNDPELRLLHAWALWHHNRSATSPDRDEVRVELLALRPDARDANLLYHMAALLLAIESPAESAEAAEAGLRLAPERWQLHDVHSLALHALGRDGEAAREVALTLGLSPHGADKRALRARLVEFVTAASRPPSL